MNKRVVVGGIGLVVILGVVVVSILKKDPEIRPLNENNRSVQKTGADLSIVTEAKLDAALTVTEREAIKAVELQSLVYAEERLGAPVKSLLGLDGEVQTYNSLMSKIGMLSKKLSMDDTMALRDLLTWSNDRFPQGMRPIEINAIKNDVLDRLLRQDVLPEEIGFQMAEMSGDPAADAVWRDYSIQFMSQFYERAAQERAGTSAPQNELNAVHTAMLTALNERGGTLAGTSLIGLELLSRTHDEFDRKLIVGKTVEIAQDESASASSRITALRLAAGLTNNEQGVSSDAVADVSRILAQTGETVLLRSTAIVTLGEMGRAEDRELLASFALSENRQVADAAKMALKKMDVNP